MGAYFHHLPVRSDNEESAIVLMADRENSERHIAAVLKLPDDELLFAYSNGYTIPNLGPYDPSVKAGIESRLLHRIANETKEFARITVASRTEVARLADSSDRIERLVCKWFVGPKIE